MTVLRYLGGIVLCFVISLVYSMAKKEGVREILRDATISFLYNLAILLGVAVVAYVWVILK